MERNIEMIIYGVQARPYLYSKYENMYKSPSDKENAYKAIADDINDHNIATGANVEAITGKVVQSCWNQLLNDFKESYNEQKNQKSGAGSTKIKFPYYEQMSFLIPHLQQRPVLSSLAAIRSFEDGAGSSKDTPSTSGRYKRPMLVPAADKHSNKKKKNNNSTTEKINENMLEILKNQLAKQKNYQEQLCSPACESSTTEVLAKSTSSMDYTNILVEAFKDIPKGAELDCLSYVLEDFAAFESLIN